MVLGLPAGLFLILTSVGMITSGMVASGVFVLIAGLIVTLVGYYEFVYGEWGDD